MSNEALIKEEAAKLAALFCGNKVQSIESLLAVQKAKCVDSYQIGIYNGLAIARAVLTGEEPEFYKEEKSDGISS